MNTSFKQKRSRTGQSGFTLIEMIVAVGLFAVVMMVSVGALLSLVTANRKAQGLQSVMNNMNVAIDGMVRAVRMGSIYHCGEGTYTIAADCSSGNSVLAFEPYHTGPTVPPWIYWYATDSKGVGRLYKSEDGTIASGLPITAPEVSIDSVKFYVLGSARGDTQQPKVLIIIKGSAGNTQLITTTTFHIQATAVQRILDL
ncbi:MAG: seg [Candidatus Kaiserbacteria bacterium]|nr:seg [Candidatus Kaiserbacteria bacterium]